MTDPRGPDFFNQVCGVTSDNQGDETSRKFAEWTPTELWFEGYTDLLQRGSEQVPEPSLAGPSKQSESHSSQASAAEGEKQ